MFTLEMGGALSDHSRLGSELTPTQEWLPWLSKFRHFPPVLRALPAFSCRCKDWEPNLENAFGAGTCRWVFSPAKLARDVLSAVLGTMQLVQHKHEQWTKTTVQSQLLLSPESSWSPQGSCCPPGVLSILPGWVQDVSCRVQHLFCTMGVKLTSRGQKFSFLPSVPREAFRSILRARHTLATKCSHPFPSQHQWRSHGWCNGRVRPGTGAQDRFWKLNRVRQQILQKYVSAVHARFWLIQQTRWSCPLIPLNPNPGQTHAPRSRCVGFTWANNFSNPALHLLPSKLVHFFYLYSTLILWVF